MAPVRTRQHDGGVSSGSHAECDDRASGALTHRKWHARKGDCRPPNSRGAKRSSLSVYADTTLWFPTPKNSPEDSNTLFTAW
jgi:hypothetical protein